MFVCAWLTSMNVTVTHMFFDLWLPSSQSHSVSSPAMRQRVDCSCLPETEGWPLPMVSLATRTRGNHDELRWVEINEMLSWNLLRTANPKQSAANKSAKQIVLLCPLCLELTFANSWNCEISPPTSDFVPLVESDSSIFHCNFCRPPTSMPFGWCHLRCCEHCDCSNLHHSHCLSVACIFCCCSCPLCDNMWLSWEDVLLRGNFQHWTLTTSYPKNSRHLESW